MDSAPVLEKALAEKAGLGWIGKHSNLLHQSNGSWFFLGEIYTDLPLAPGETSNINDSDSDEITADRHDTAIPVNFNSKNATAAAVPAIAEAKNKKAHCGSCTACIDACPTRAIVAPYKVCLLYTSPSPRD